MLYSRMYTYLFHFSLSYILHIVLTKVKSVIPPMFKIKKHAVKQHPEIPSIVEVFFITVAD